jgi:hypothetical protein
LHPAGVIGAKEKSMRTLTRRTPIRTGVLAVLMLVTLNVQGRAAELAGATLPDTLSAGDKTLKLNGKSGLRFGVFVSEIWEQRGRDHLSFGTPPHDRLAQPEWALE